MMKNLLIFSIFCGLIVVLTACPADTTPNSNLTANVPPKTPFLSNQESNINIISNRTEANTMATPEIDQGTIKIALKKELRNKNANVMTAEQWETEGWLNLAFSRFYGDRPRLVSDAVVKVTNGLLSQQEKRMLEAAERELRGSVKPDTLCKDAVEPMWRASAKNESTRP